LASPTNEMREMARVIVQRFYQCLERGCEEDLEDAITAALTEARREGAVAMRERAVAQIEDMRVSFGTDEFAIGGDVQAQIVAGMWAATIRALPLTGKEDEGIGIIVGRSLEEDLASVDAAFARLKGEADNG
jgi:hypothetical protein